MTLPHIDAPHSDYVEWAARLNPEQRCRMAAAIIMQELEPDGDFTIPAAEVFAEEMGPDYTAAFTAFAAEVKRRA